MSFRNSLRLLAAGLVGWSLVAASPLATAAAHGPTTHPARPLIVFLSDFGTIDDAVAICKGVMLGIAPGADIIDLTHQVTPFSISEGARMLTRTAPYYPKGTVFVTVIDPGVGTARRSIVIKTRRGQFFVLPDNGLITQIADRDGLEGVREIKNVTWLYGGSLSSTFHGRDIFSPVAAHLARGDDWRTVGPELPTWKRLDVPQPVGDATGITGLVVALDGPYGNLVTNVDRDAFRGLGYVLGDPVRVRIGDADFTLPYVATFGAVPTGQPLAYIDSRGLLSVAVNQGNFAEDHGVKPPVTLVVYRK